MLVASDIDRNRIAPLGERREQIRDALERFDLPTTDLRSAELSPLGTLTVNLPVPDKGAYAGLMNLLEREQIAVALADKDASLVRMPSGLVFEFWPADDRASRLVIDGIISDDAEQSGRRFCEAVRIVQLLHGTLPHLTVQASEAELDMREQALMSAFSVQELDKLQNAIASLKNAGFTTTIQSSAANGMSFRIFREPDISYTFDKLDAFVSYAASLEAPKDARLAAAGSRIARPEKTSGRQRSMREPVIFARRETPLRLMPWLYVLAMVAAISYALYRWLI